jgi:hypothetical protein
MKVNLPEVSLTRFRSEHEKRGDDGGLVVRRLANERLGAAGTWLSGGRSVGDDGWTGGQFLKCGRGRSGLTPMSSTKSPWPLVVLRQPKGLLFFFSFFFQEQYIKKIKLESVFHMNRTKRKRKLENNNFFLFSIPCKIYCEDICKILTIKIKMKYKEK